MPERAKPNRKPPSRSRNGPAGGRRKARQAEAPAAGRGPAEEAQAGPEVNGQVQPLDSQRYDESDILDAEWFWHPWIPCHDYTLIVGHAGTGKSTFGAFLAARAKRPVIMPGEEDIRRVVLPRLRAAGVDLSAVRFVASSERCAMPRDRDRLIRLVWEHRADFVLVDPLDSYAERLVDENQNIPVRSLLDSFTQTAAVTGIAIVLIRHPGKQRGNLLAGSRAFSTHPRGILRLDIDPDNRGQGVLMPHKPPLGRDTPPHWYKLLGAPGEPKRFALAEEASIDRAQELQEVGDRVMRRRIDDAADYLKRVLDGGVDMDCVAIFAMADKEKFSPSTLYAAASRLGVERTYSGGGGTLKTRWRLPR